MDMRMNFEFLAPGVQHAEEANLCAEVSRIASDFEKGFGTGAEQEIVEDLLVLQNQWRQAAGECEDHVQVAGREQFSSTRSDPAFPCSDLTLRAVAIAAANGVLSITCIMVSIFYWRVRSARYHVLTGLPGF